MPYKFEQLEVWQLSLEYIEVIYKITEQLPRSEEFNLRSQLIRAVTSISLNIAEGSTSQTNAKQARFLGVATRSLIETVACQNLIRRRGYLSNDSILAQAYDQSQTLARKPQAFRKSLSSHQIREDTADYLVDNS